MQTTVAYVVLFSMIAVATIIGVRILIVVYRDFRGNRWHISPGWFDRNWRPR